jgi:hypothetical protein
VADVQCLSSVIKLCLPQLESFKNLSRFVELALRMHLYLQGSLGQSYFHCSAPRLDVRFTHIVLPRNVPMQLIYSRMSTSRQTYDDTKQARGSDISVLLWMIVANIGRRYGSGGEMEDSDGVVISSPDEEEAQGSPEKRRPGRPKKEKDIQQQRKPEHRSSELDDEYIPNPKGARRRQVPSTF